MKLIGLMPVRNEEWCLGLTLRAALMWCDEVIVGLHACTDRSAGIAVGVATEYLGSDKLRVFVQPFRDPTWAEMSHRQQLLETARKRGATHIAMIDADEVLTGNLLPEIQNRVLCVRDGETLQLPWLALPRALGHYITSGVWGPGQQVSMAFRDAPEAHWATRNGYDFHHRNPMGFPAGRFYQPLKPHQGGIMHLQFLSERRLRAKQQLYIQTEMIRWPGRKTAQELSTMYGRAVYDSAPEKVSKAPVPLDWWSPYAHLMKHLDLDESKVPWQEIAVHENLKKLGKEFFAGVDSFGLY